MNGKHLGKIIIGFTILFCALAPSYVLAQTSVVITADQQFEFAEDYFQQGDYYRAVGEYERFIHFFPEEPRVESARYRIGLAYFEGRRFKEAIEPFKGLIEQFHGTELSLKSYLKIAECHVKIGELDEALGTLDDLLRISQDQEVRDATFYRSGWIFLEMDDWEKAQEAFARISPENRDRYRLQALSEEINKKESIKTKRPTTAGLLAVLPGGGHLYCERYRDALVSFVLNGAMIFAAVEAFDNDNETLGGLLAFFEIGLYSGNIYSAVNSAHKHNSKQKHDFLEYLKEHAALEVSGQSLDKDRAVALCCKIRF